MIVSAYRKDENLRHQLNALTRLTYGFDFEAWYQAGHWSDMYIPYSLLVDGKLVANVSANIMPCVVDGEKKRYIQLGTVMTHPEYRGRGYSRRLMEHVVAQWKDCCDGMYLYPNGTVQQFYPRFGFVSATEYRYRVPEPLQGHWGAISVSPDDEGFRRAVRCSAPQARLWVENPGLVMFYAEDGNVFYLPSLDAYAIAERDGDVLRLNQLFARTPVDPIGAAQLLGGGNVHFGFTPLDTAGLVCEPYVDPDAPVPVFALGDGLPGIAAAKLGFPVLSHA